MSARNSEQPFDTIESAHEYMDVLATTVLETLGELKHDQDRALRNGEQRKAQAIGLALYKLKTLECYVYKSRRTLNDLRTLRRLILSERSMDSALVSGSR